MFSSFSQTQFSWDLTDLKKYENYIFKIGNKNEKLLLTLRKIVSYTNNLPNFYF